MEAKILGFILICIALYVFYKLVSKPKQVEPKKIKTKETLEEESLVEDINQNLRDLLYKDKFLMKSRKGIGLGSDNQPPDKMLQWDLKFSLDKYSLHWTHLIRIQGLSIETEAKEVFGYTLTSPNKYIYDLLDELSTDEKVELLLLIKGEMNYGKK